MDVLYFIGLPASVIIVWILYRIQVDDTLCWTTHSNISFMIIRIPTMISVLVKINKKLYFINIALKKRKRYF